MGKRIVPNGLQAREAADVEQTQLGAAREKVRRETPEGREEAQVNDAQGG